MEEILLQAPGGRSVSMPVNATPSRETEKGIVLVRFSGGAPNCNLDFSGIEKKLALCGRRRDPVPAHRDHGVLQFPGPADGHPGISSEAIDFGSGAFPYLAASAIAVTRA